MTKFVISFLLISILSIGIFAFKLRKVNLSHEKMPFYKSAFWGLSSFIYDKGLYLLSRYHVPYKISSSKIYTQLRHLYPGENTLLHYENFIITSICYFFISYFIGALFISCMYFSNLSSTSVKTLERPDFNSAEDTHNLIVSVDGKESDIDITISPKKLSNKEILDIFDSMYDRIVDSFLADNTSLDKVTTKLNFVYSVSGSSTGNRQVFIHWRTTDNTLIKYNGELNYENIPEEGIETTVYADLQLERYDFTATKEFTIILYPQKKDNNTLLIEEINNFINDEETLQKKHITLPTNSTQGKLKFFESKEEFPIFIFPIFFICLTLIVYGKLSNLKGLLQKRNSELLNDYPEIISKLTLLYCAGLNIQNSFRRIARDYEQSDSEERYAYEEIKLMLKSIDNGTSESVAYKDFGHNCVHPCYIKLGTLLSQNLKRGSSEIYSLLEFEVMNSLQDKKAMIKIEGEKASTKALVPMVLMLLVVFIIIIAPAFMSI